MSWIRFVLGIFGIFKNSSIHDFLNKKSPFSGLNITSNPITQVSKNTELLVLSKAKNQSISSENPLDTQKVLETVLDEDVIEIFV